jgi:hypothetical protein
MFGGWSPLPVGFSSPSIAQKVIVENISQLIEQIRLTHWRAAADESTVFLNTTSLSRMGTLLCVSISVLVLND